MKGYEYQSAFARQYVAQGRAEGLAQGHLEAVRRAVLTVLQVRGIDVPDAARECILSEKDLERLERWLKKAVVASSFSGGA